MRALFQPQWAGIVATFLVGNAAFALGEPLTLDQAIEKALSGEPSVRSARAKKDELDANVSAAWSAIFPTVSSSVYWLQRKDAASSGSALFGGESYNTYDWSFKLAQPVFTGGKVLSGLRIVKLNRQVGDLQVAIAERDLVVSVTQKFLSVLLAEKKVDTLRKSEEVQKELLKVTQRRLSIGTSRRVEYLQQKSELALLMPRILEAENDLKTSAAELAKLVGGMQDTEIRVKGKLDSLDPSRAPILVQGPRPELQKKALERESLDENKTYSLAVHWPQLSLGATWGRFALQKSGLFEDQNTRWTFGATLDVPLFSGLSSVFERKAFASKAAQLEMDETGLRDTLAVESVQAEQDWKLSQTRLAAYRDALDQSREALKEARSDYRYGRATYQQLAETEKNALTAELSYLQGQWDAVMKLMKYVVSRGGDPKSVVSLLL